MEFSRPHGTRGTGPSPRPGRPPRQRGAAEAAGGLLSRPAAALVLAVAVAAGGCIPKPQVPVGVDPPPSPFERAPYLQAVHDDRAMVIWRMERPGTSSRLRYRVEGGAWTEPDVQQGDRGDRKVVLEDLPRASTVEFAVRAGDHELGPYRFRTAPPDTSEAAVDVLAFGDSGWGSAAQIDLGQQMHERPWDLAVHVGDIAYPDGSEEDLTIRHFRVYGSLLARVPFFPSPGNHDVRTAGGGGEAYDRAFEWPGGEGGARHYTLRWGRTQFLALDTSSDSVVQELEEREGPQFRWLVATLDSLARDTTLDWTVVFTHFPLYSQSVGFSGHRPNRELRDALEPLFLEHGVDVVLTGHDHHYERSRPLRDGSPVPPGCGPVYFVTGGGGATRFARSVAPEGPAAAASREYHFLALRLGRSTDAGEGTGSGEAIGRDGEVLDRFRLVPYEPDGSPCPD